MRSTPSRFNEFSTSSRIQRADRSFFFIEGFISEPTLVNTTTLSRLDGLAFSHLPMIVSDSPPLLPGTQVE
jgi:hypothetical protein